MSNSTPRRRALTLAALLTLALTVLGALRPAAAQEESRTFPETGKTVKGPFLKYWDEHDGLALDGLPISDEGPEKSQLDGNTYTTQYFERTVFEQHPENQPPFDVLLAQLGRFRYTRLYPNGAPGQHASTDKPRLFPETGKTLGGPFRQFWETHGGLYQIGFPISDEFEEKNETNGKTYTVQYFERVAMEHHPEFAGTPNEVLLSTLGRWYLDLQHQVEQTGTATASVAASTTAAATSVADPTNAAATVTASAAGAADAAATATAQAGGAADTTATATASAAGTADAAATATAGAAGVADTVATGTAAAANATATAGAAGAANVAATATAAAVGTADAAATGTAAAALAATTATAAAAGITDTAATATADTPGAANAAATATASVVGAANAAATMTDGAANAAATATASVVGAANAAATTTAAAVVAATAGTIAGFPWWVCCLLLLLLLLLAFLFWWFRRRQTEETLETIPAGAGTLPARVTPPPAAPPPPEPPPAPPVVVPPPAPPPPEPPVVVPPPVPEPIAEETHEVVPPPVVLPPVAESPPRVVRIPASKGVLPVLATATGPVGISHIAYKGTEYIEITNSGEGATDLSGWMLRDQNDIGQEYRFPDGTRLEPGATLQVYAAPGHPHTFNTRRPIMNDLGDVFELLDQDRQVVSTYAYGSYAAAGEG